MTTTTIIGVDFSGAKEENKTWIAPGTLTGAGELHLENPWCITRADLCELLVGISPPAVVGMDFPFGLPKCFAEAEFGFTGTQVPEMWEIIPNRDDLPEYIEKIRPRLRAGGELSKFNKSLRQGDEKYFAGVAYSPLNPAAPEMFPMTFYGMQMLHTLWTQSDCRIPPLDDAGRNGAVLIELMPGAFLQVCGLPSRHYKDNRDRRQMLHRRMIRGHILDGLPARTGWPELDLSGVWDACIANDDCLDAVVAAVCAASWARSQDHFHHPTADEIADARLEGWIYIPKVAGAIPSAG